MSQISFNQFQKIIQTRPNAELLVDHHTGELKTHGGNALRRMVRWVQKRLGGDSRQQRAETERAMAYNSFLRSMDKEVRYSESERNWVQGHLESDYAQGKSLSARRVRTLLDSLDEPRVGRVHARNYRQNRMTAHHASGKAGAETFSRSLQEKIAQRAPLAQAGYTVSAEDLEQLSQRIFDAVMEAGGGVRNDPEDPAHVVSEAESHLISQQVTDGFLDAEEARLQAPQGEATAEAPADAPGAGTTAGTEGSDEQLQPPAEDLADDPATDPYMARFTETLLGKTTGGTAHEAPVLAGAIHESPSPGQPAGATREAPAPGKSSQRELLQQLKAADLPDSSVRAELQKQIREGKIADSGALAGGVNHCIADWVAKNRIERWYREGLKQAGVTGSKSAEPPAQLARAISGAIRKHPGLFAYTDVKVQAREQVRDFLAEQYSGGKGNVRGGKSTVSALSKRLESINLPNEVRAEMRKLVAERRVSSLAELAKITNRKTAVWAGKNRIAKWYMEGLKNAGRPVPKQGTVPQKLVDDIIDSVALREGLCDYDSVKTLARAKVRAYLKGGEG